MAVRKMTVCAAPEQPLEAAQYPYQFYAQSGPDVYTVNLVMPFGGQETGFYRYPKEGDLILVDDDGNENPSFYLIGYLPSANDAKNTILTNTNANDRDAFEKEKKALKDEEPMILRYRQTGKKEPSGDASERYSELGFYRRPTQWKAAQKDSYNDFDKDHADLPKIDRLNIQSTGDIHTRAANHHRMKAKRIELLSNVDESDFSKELKGQNRPFGDKGADISELFKGDIHIRGKRRIILKAGSEIRLEVGRSTIIISDAGIILTSRKTHSDIHNSLDTVLSVLPRNGITMFGQHLKLAAAYDWAILENMGSSIKGTAGIMRLEGKDIKASTISGVAYITNFITQSAVFIDNLVSMSVGTHDSDNVQDATMPSLVGTGVGIAGILLNVGLGLKFPAMGEDDDPDSKIVKFTALAIQLMGTVIGVIETIYISPEDKTGKDALALAGIIAEWGCLLPIFIAICAASMGPFLIHNDSVHWGNNGNLTLLGTYIKQFSLNYKFTNSPFSGVVTPAPEKDDKKWHEKLLGFLNDNWKWLKWVIFGGFGIAGAGIGGGIATVDRVGSLSAEKERLLRELNEL